MNKNEEKLIKDLEKKMKTREGMGFLVGLCVGFVFGLIPQILIAIVLGVGIYVIVRYRQEANENVCRNTKRS